MVRRRRASGLGGVMMVRGKHRRVDRMSCVFCAESLAHLAGKGSADDHESESERQQAPSHVIPSIPNPHRRQDEVRVMAEATAELASSPKSARIAERENSLLSL